MSEYFRVLKRIETDQPRHTVPPPALAAAKRAPGPAPLMPEVPIARASSAAQASPISPASAAAFATLFDNLRALANGHPARNLVFAGASTLESVRAVTTGLALHLETLGLQVLVAELTDAGGRSALRRRRGEWNEGLDERTLVALDLHGSAWSSEFANWLRVATPCADLVIIEGRPLAKSIDSALLARACDGLVIVAQPEVTHREALQVAAERARVVGCRTLGVVMHAAKDPIPRWMRRVLTDDRRTRSEREN